MDFLKKAQAQMKALEKDLSKATEALGLGDNKSDSAKDTTSSSGAAYTPATTEAGDAGRPAGDLVTAVTPKEGGSAKLPLAIRKSVRDDFESKKPELEKKLSELLKTPWTMFVDVGPVYSYALEGQAKDNPGRMFYEYYERAAQSVEKYVQKQGDEGINTLNSVAAHHVITLEPSEKISTCGGDIEDGKVRMLFNPQRLGYNCSDAIAELDLIVHRADAAAIGPAKLPLMARASIKRDYEAKIGEVLEAARKEVDMPSLQFEPNFEANFAKLNEFNKANPGVMQNDWDRRVGEVAFRYYKDGLLSEMQGKKFGGDEMMQEGFKDAVDSGRVELRVVDKLQKRSYNECVLEGGVLYLQTVPKCWYTNVTDIAADLVALL